MGESMVEWKTSEGLIAYPHAIREMEWRAESVFKHEAEELVWFLEHPPVYTAGTSADQTELISQDHIPVYKTGRGGRYTYHGPGQLIGYVLLDLRRRRKDVRWFVSELEDWIIASLSDLGVEAGRRSGRIGIWVIDRNGQDSKIGALGIRIRKWITFHGFSLNIDPDLDQFAGIIPCGLPEYPVTSLRAFGCNASRADLQRVLRGRFHRFFGGRTGIENA